MISRPLGDAVRRAILSAGYRNLQEFSSRHGLTYEMVRSVANEGHIPKSKLLLDISRALAIDPTPLLTLAESGRRGREERRILGNAVSPNLSDDLSVALSDLEFHELDQGQRDLLLTVVRHLPNLEEDTIEQVAHLLGQPQQSRATS